MNMVCKDCGVKFDYKVACKEYEKKSGLVNRFLSNDEIPTLLCESWDNGIVCADCAIDEAMNRKINFERQKSMLIHAHGYE